MVHELLWICPGAVNRFVCSTPERVPDFSEDRLVQNHDAKVAGSLAGTWH